MPSHLKGCVAAAIAASTYAEWPGITPFGVPHVARTDAPPAAVAEEACAGYAGDANAECVCFVRGTNVRCRNDYGREPVACNKVAF